MWHTKKSKQEGTLGKGKEEDMKTRKFKKFKKQNNNQDKKLSLQGTKRKNPQTVKKQQILTDNNVSSSQCSQ
jgi:hypothetical protein